MSRRRKTRDRFYNEEEFCTKGCGRSNRINPISLGRAQGELLVMLAHKYNGRATHKEMRLRQSDYPTINWLRYFELVERIDGKVGTFKVTQLGYAFLAGEHRIAGIAWMFDSRILDFEEEESVGIEDVLGQAYATYEDVLNFLAENYRLATRDELDENMELKGLTPPPRARRKVSRRSREAETEPSPSRPLARHRRRVTRHPMGSR